MKRFFGRAAAFLIKTLVQFAAAGGLYYGCETLFRLYRHHEPPLPHVFFLGGSAYLLLVLVAHIPLNGVKKRFILPPLGAMLLTGWEYLFGWYFVTYHDLWIWNYTGCPLQYNGLISLQFSLCWIGAELAAMLLDALTEKLLTRTPFSYRRIFGRF